MITNKDFVLPTCNVPGCKRPTYEFTTDVRRVRCKEHAQVAEWKKRSNRIRCEDKSIFGKGIVV